MTALEELVAPEMVSTSAEFASTIAAQTFSIATSPRPAVSACSGVVTLVILPPSIFTSTVTSPLLPFCVDVYVPSL